MIRTIRSISDFLKLFQPPPVFNPNFKEIFNVTHNRIAIKKILKGTPSPLYIYSSQIFLHRLRQLQSELKNNWGASAVAFSFKTNYSIATSPLIKDNALLAEVVSAREFDIAINSGFDGTNIIYNGPNKSPLSLKQAIVKKTLINIDHFSEIDDVIKIATKLNHHARVGIRVSGDIKNIGQSRFGFNMENEQAIQATQKILSSSRLRFEAIHLHVGTDIDNPLSYADASSKLALLIRNQHNKFGFTPKIIDFGGGFPANGYKPYWKKSWSPKTISNYIKAITIPLKTNYPVNQLPTLIVEPGRYLVDDAGIFINRVVDIKKDNRQQQITTDGSVVFLPVKYYRPQLVRIFNSQLKQKHDPTISSLVFGATCKEDDQLYSGSLSQASVGDYLVFYIAGAYNENMAPDFIFNKPKSIIL